MREKFDSQNYILKFNQIVVLKSLPESNPKPEVENPKPEMMDYEKPDPTRYPNAQTRPDPKPEKSLPDHALTDTVFENYSKSLIKKYEISRQK